MRKLIAAINMSLDGNCDHMAMTPDEEIHQHYTALLNSGGAIIYGRITYQLMEGHWPGLVKTPSGEKSMDEFALAIDKIPKIVFSHSLKNVGGWKTARLAKGTLAEEVSKLKLQPGKDILVGSRSLIIALLNLNLIDEFQLCVHPVIVGKGPHLFEQINDRINLRLLKTKTYSASGAVMFYYEPSKKW